MPSSYQTVHLTIQFTHPQPTPPTSPSHAHNSGTPSKKPSPTSLRLTPTNHNLAAVPGQQSRMAPPPVPKRGMATSSLQNLINLDLTCLWVMIASSFSCPRHNWRLSTLRGRPSGSLWPIKPTPNHSLEQPINTVRERQSHQCRCRGAPIEWKAWMVSIDSTKSWERSKATMPSPASNWGCKAEVRSLMAARVTGSSGARCPRCRRRFAWARTPLCRRSPDWSSPSLPSDWIPSNQAFSKIMHSLSMHIWRNHNITLSRNCQSLKSRHQTINNHRTRSPRQNKKKKYPIQIRRLRRNRHLSKKIFRATKDIWPMTTNWISK